MDAATRSLVRRRAEDRCEYRRIRQEFVEFRLHIEPIRARQHGGSDEPSNLALACSHRNLHKGPNLTGVDPESGRVALLFDPRNDAWDEHSRSVAR